MSSLALLQNYSDSEDDDRSSDEERRTKRLRANDQLIKNELNQNEEDLVEDDLDEESDEDKLESNRNELNRNELNRNELNRNELKNQSSSNSLTNSPELTPSLKQIKLDKSNESTKQRINYQDYLEDDIYTLDSNINSEEDEEDTIESKRSIIEIDSTEPKESNANSSIDKLDCSQYSPRSFHRLLLGIDEQDIRIPDAPKDKQCSATLIDKINRSHSLMKQGRNMNDQIQQSKEFRNPSIYEKLIHHCGIDEFGTNLPAEIFDPYQFREKDSHESTT